MEAQNGQNPKEAYTNTQVYDSIQTEQQGMGPFRSKSRVAAVVTEGGGTPKRSFQMLSLCESSINDILQVTC